MLSAPKRSDVTSDGATDDAPGRSESAQRELGDGREAGVLFLVVRTLVVVVRCPCRGWARGRHPERSARCDRCGGRVPLVVRAIGAA